MRLQALKLGALSVIGIVLVACGGSSSSTTQSLASDQTLKFPIFGEFGTLDPGQLDAEVDSEIAQNVFNGPLRYDNNLNIDEALQRVVFQNNAGNGTNQFALAFELKSTAAGAASTSAWCWRCSARAGCTRPCSVSRTRRRTGC